MVKRPRRRLQLVRQLSSARFSSSIYSSISLSKFSIPTSIRSKLSTGGVGSRKAIASPLFVSTSKDDLELCSYVLVYLNSQTWTSGTASKDFAEEVDRAMRAGVKVLLAHEMVGGGGQEKPPRHGCEFNSFFAREDDGGTPMLLTKRIPADQGGKETSIYDRLAIALKGGAWREVSMIMLREALGEAPPSNEVLAEQKNVQQRARMQANAPRPHRTQTATRVLEVHTSDPDVTLKATGIMTRAALRFSERTSTSSATAASRRRSVASVTSVASIESGHGGGSSAPPTPGSKWSVRSLSVVSAYARGCRGGSLAAASNPSSRSSIVASAASAVAGTC